MRVSRGSIFATLFLLAAFGTLAFSVWWAADMTAILRQTRRAFAIAQSQADRAGALQARWQGVAEKAGTISGAFLGRNDLASFLGLVEQTASAAGVTEETSIVLQSDEALTLLFRARGPFPNLFTFMAHINVLPKLLFVQEVRFQSADVENSDLRTLEVLVRVPLRAAPGQSTPQGNGEASADQSDVLQGAAP